MNNLPLIHSISTVGVIKHYNQDYLLHNTRTDFTGSNGIGKSLIADLLQVLFIADRKKITFGTESLKKEERQIFTIPYKSSDAYFFLNIEIEKEKFITFGVNIPSSSNAHIKLFRILNHYYEPEKESSKTLNERKKIGHLLIPANKIPYNRDFLLNGNEIPKIDQLTKYLRDEKNLYLESFTSKKEKKKLYEFLFEKGVLPINLGIDNHLTAFSKVLQAFSKANTLNTDKDDSLKAFLFEDKKTEIELTYQQNKEKLDRLVDSYTELRELTDSLEEKEILLHELEKQHLQRESSEKDYLLTKFLDQEKLLNKVELKLKLESNNYNSISTEIKKCEQKIPVLEQEEKLLKEKFKIHNDSFIKLNNYKSEYEDLQKIKSEYELLISYPFPIVKSEDNRQFNFSNLSVSYILEKTKAIRPILEKYGSISKINAQYQNQCNERELFKQNLNSDLKKFKRIKSFIDLTDTNSLTAQIIKKRKSLSKAQETILLDYLLDTFWERPKNELVKPRSQFVIDLKILDEVNITDDKKLNGYWLQTGELSTYIPYSNEKQIFNNQISELNKIFTNKTAELTKKIKEIESKLMVIDNLENLKEQPPEIDFYWDFNLSDKRRINECEKDIIMLQNIHLFIESSKATLNGLKKSLEVKKRLIAMQFNDNQIQDILDSYSTKNEELNNKLLTASKLVTEEKTTLRLKKEELKRINYDPEKAIKENRLIKQELNNIKKEITDKYPNIINNASRATLEEEDFEKTQSIFFKSKSEYETSYSNIFNSDQMLIDDIEMREQMDKEIFNFEILERKLLGNSIGKTKNIRQAFNAANEEKRKLSSALREIMLKIFQKTQNEYDNYKGVIGDLNSFFKNKLISKKYYFQVRFSGNDSFSTDWINELPSKAQNTGNEGELFESNTVEEFVEDFFMTASKYKERINFSDLLDPKTYFTLKTEFKDQFGKEYSGSTGESYTARVLLGIGRLSIASKENREGLKFLILEEVSSLDKTNFNTFPEIAKEFGYQIITMTPEPFGSDTEEGWYLHQLIEGMGDTNINYPTPNSSFKTNYSNEQLNSYLKKTNI